MKKLNNLPEPLSQEQIIILYKQYQQGNLEAKKIILNHNIKLIIDLVLKQFNIPYYDKEDLICIGLLGLTESIDKYNINKNVKFSTFATHCARNKIISYLRANKKTMDVVSIYDNLFIGSDGHEITLEDSLQDNSFDIQTDYEKNVEIQIIRNLVEELPEKQKLIIKLYFGFDCEKHTLKEIGKILNVTSQYVHIVLKRTLNELKDQLTYFEFKKTSK